MDKNNNNDKNKDFLEVLENEKSLTPNINQEILFIPTDNWLAQLGSRRKN